MESKQEFYNLMLAHVSDSDREKQEHNNEEDLETSIEGKHNDYVFTYSK
jgi:hypothetical protein